MSVELDVLEAAVEVAGKIDVAGLSSAERTAAVEQMVRIEARLAAVRSELLSEFDAALDFAVDGHRSAAVAIRHRCRMRGAEASGVVRLARALRRMELTSEWLADGRITEAHARRLAPASSRPEFATADGEAFLLAKAEGLSFRDWVRVVDYWEQTVDENRRDPGDPEPSDPREDNRSLHASRTLNGATRLDGWLDALGGDAVREALRRIEQELFDNDWQLAKTEWGDAVTVERLWRTPTQRRADALVEMAHRALTAPADGKRPEPLLILHTDLDTFETALARALGEPAPEPLGTTRMCETDDGTVITPTQMIETAVSGRVRRLVYQAPGVILDYGRTVRLFTGALRQAIQARDRTCDHPGCDIPARHCDIDHTTQWHHGGRTDHHNGKAKCSYHHRNHKPRPG